VKTDHESYGLVIRDRDSDSWGNLDTNDGYFAIGYGNHDGAALCHNARVGIGTRNPEAALHVNGEFRSNWGEGFSMFGDINYFGQWQDGIVFQMRDNNSRGGRTDGGFVFRGYTPTDDVATDWVVIKTPGRVGIGTTDPAGPLDVNGQLRVYTDSFVEVKTDHESYGLVIRDRDSDSWGNLDTNDGYLAIGYGNHDGPLYVTNARVGIGTTEPIEALHVAGNGYFTGTITTGSSRTLKQDIETLSSDRALDAFHGTGCGGVFLYCGPG
jgi:hypothetical protein